MRLNDVIKIPLKRFMGGAFVIFLVTFAIYIPTLKGDFIWDDDDFLYNNNLIKADDGLYSFWFSTKPPDYFPLTSTTLWLEWRLWGKNALGYRVVNVLLHIISSVLIWLILKRLKIPGAWLAALIFAVHPVNVETVAWITQRKNTLSMVFYSLSILLYLKFETNESRWLYGFSLGVFLLALLSKTSVIMLPFVLLGCAWWQRGRIVFRDLLRSIPYFVMAGIMSLVTIWFQYSTIGGDIVRTDSFLSRLAGAGWAAWYYLYKAVLPINLIFVYPRWKIDDSAIFSYVPGLILVGLLITFWWYRKSWGKPFLFGLGYFVTTLFPVMGFFNIYFMRYSLVADHWQYSSIIGIIALPVGIGSHAYRRRPELFRWLSTVAVVVIISVLALLTWKQGHIYKDQETLYRDIIAKNRQCWLAHNNLGVALVNQGKIDEAVSHYVEAMRLKSDFEQVHYNLGFAFFQKGNTQKAIDYYLEALRLKPDYAAGHSNLGVALQKEGRMDEAIGHFLEALRIRPDAGVYNNLGAAFLGKGKTLKAIDNYLKALRLKPDYVDAHYNLGIALEKKGRLDEAAGHYLKALNIRPDYVAAHNNLGIILEKKGHVDEAIGHYMAALRINPDFEKVHNNLGIAFSLKGNIKRAIYHFNEALRLNPDDANAKNNLQKALMIQQQNQ